MPSRRRPVPRPGRGLGARAAAALLALAGILTGCAPVGPGLPGRAGPADPVGTAAELLATLPVKGRAPKTGYGREAFGPAWADVDGNGCDTRDDVLRRDLEAVSLRRGSDGCRVSRGTLHGPYTGKTIAFRAGEGTSEAVQIDHVVALSDAWQTGAQQLTAAQRQALANDPLNLLAVDGPANQAKSDADAASWLPPRTAYRCPYVARQVAVKAKYGLWVTRAERDAIARVLAGCPGQGVPDPTVRGSEVTAASGLPVPTSSPAPSATGSASAAPSTPDRTTTAGAFAGCADARAAGAAPLHRGEPGYRASLDGDGDGVACE